MDFHPFHSTFRQFSTYAGGISKHNLGFLAPMALIINRQSVSLSSRTNSYIYTEIIPHGTLHCRVTTREHSNASRTMLFALRRIFDVMLYLWGNFFMLLGVCCHSLAFDGNSNCCQLHFFMISTIRACVRSRVPISVEFEFEPGFEIRFCFLVTLRFTFHQCALAICKFYEQSLLFFLVCFFVFWVFVSCSLRFLGLVHAGFVAVVRLTTMEAIMMLWLALPT